jgi:large conductance mechanosensitive channel
VSEQGKGLVAGVTGVLTGFRDFLMRGNVVELAVAVVIGTAFTNIVNSVVDGFVNPLIGAFGTQDLDAYQSCLRGPCEVNEAGEIVNGIPIQWGSVISATISFLITAAVVYFLLILPISRFMARLNSKTEVPAEPTEVEILKEIRDELIAQRTAAGSGADTNNTPAPAARLTTQRTSTEDGPGA